MDEENKTGLTLGKIARVVVVGGPVVAAAALSQFDPHTAALWAASTMSLQLMSPTDREIFATEFSSNKAAIAEEILHSEEFVRAFKTTIEAASKTKSEEKIRLIARLLRSGAEQGVINDFDEFKEYVDIADDLSSREVVALTVLDRFLTAQPGAENPESAIKAYKYRVSSEVATYPRPRLDDPELYSANYEQIINEGKMEFFGREIRSQEFSWLVVKLGLMQKLSVSETEVQGILSRISRTGLITLTHPTFGKRPNIEAVPTLTHIFYKFKGLVLKEHNTIC